MARSNKKKVEKPFNSGLCSVYKAVDRQLREKIGDFYFQDETIGIKSFSELQAIGREVERVISIPYNKLIDLAKAIKIEDTIYQIELIQPKDTFPKSLRITLSRSPFKWSSMNN